MGLSNSSLWLQRRFAARCQSSTWPLHESWSSNTRWTPLHTTMQISERHESHILTLIHLPYTLTWWRHQMETFSALLAICAGNSPVPGEFPTQRPVTWSFDVYFDLRPNKRLSKQSWGWWFETLSLPLWRQRNESAMFKQSNGYLATGFICCVMPVRNFCVHTKDL